MLQETQHYRMILLGDINLDQMLQENVYAFQQLCEYFKFNQRFKYSIHILRGILDLAFDQKRTETVQWMPSPFSDHFVIIIEV